MTASFYCRADLPTRPLSPVPGPKVETVRCRSLGSPASLASTPDSTGLERLDGTGRVEMDQGLLGVIPHCLDCLFYLRLLSKATTPRPSSIGLDSASAVPKCQPDTDHTRLEKRWKHAIGSIGQMDRW